MNSVKITLIIVSMISEMFYLTLAVLTPIYVTPGWYFWTAFFIILMFMQALALGSKFDSWDWK